MFSLISSFFVILPACDGRRMRHSDSAQQAVFRSVQLPVCPIRGGVHWDGGPSPPGPLLTLRPVQSSHCCRAPALWSRGPGEASDGSGGVQVWDGWWGKECRGCSFLAAVAVLQLLQHKYMMCVFSEYCDYLVTFEIGEWGGNLSYHCQDMNIIFSFNQYSPQ